MFSIDMLLYVHMYKYIYMYWYVYIHVFISICVCVFLYVFHTSPQMCHLYPAGRRWWMDLCCRFCWRGWRASWMQALPFVAMIFFSSNMGGFEEIPRFFLKSEVGFFCSWLLWAIQSHSLSRKRLGLKWLVRKVELGCRSSLVIWSVVKKMWPYRFENAGNNEIDL